MIMKMKSTLLLAGIVALALTREISAAPTVNLVKEATVIKAALAEMQRWRVESGSVLHTALPEGEAFLRDDPRGRPALLLVRKGADNG